MFYWQAAKGNKPGDFDSPYYGYNREGCQTQVNFNETGTDWFLRSDFIYETERETGAANLTKIEDRTFWNARTGLQEEKWELNFYINNILDQTAAASILQFVNFEDVGEPGPASDGRLPASYAISPLPGRNYGLEAIFRFGG
jgi:outer membrane receptor protein involved in Fe transport